MGVVRYLVDDVDAAVAFYTDHLGFTLERRMGPAFAIVSHADLSLWLSGPQSSAARPMPDGRRPESGGLALMTTCFSESSFVSAAVSMNVGTCVLNRSTCTGLASPGGS